MTKHKDIIKYYIECGKLQKLKSFVRKHNFNPSMILDKKGRTALHLSCHWQQLDIVLFLLRQGSDPLAKDSKGNIAIQTALKAKIQSRKVFRKIIKTLLKLAPESLYIPNFKGKTCKNYLDDLKIYTVYDNLPQNETCQEENDWSARLQAEAEAEYFENWGDYEEDYTVPERESYDDWVNRMHREFRQKKETSNFSFPSTSKENDSHSKESPRWTESDQARFEERCQEEERKRLSDTEKRLNKKRKKRYEHLCRYIFDENKITIHSADIPEEDDLLMVLKTIEDSEAEQKKYLREQQIKWHPDKFLQKCGHKINEEEKNVIMTKVNKISQIINSHLQV